MFDAKKSFGEITNIELFKLKSDWSGIYYSRVISNNKYYLVIDEDISILSSFWGKIN